MQSPPHHSSASLLFLSSSHPVLQATQRERPSPYLTALIQELLQLSAISLRVSSATKTVASTPSLPHPCSASLLFRLSSRLTPGGMPPAPRSPSPTVSSQTLLQLSPSSLQDWLATTPAVSTP